MAFKNAGKENEYFIILTVLLSLSLIVFFVLYLNEILIISITHLIPLLFGCDQLGISFCLVDLVLLDRFELGLACKIFQTLYKSSNVLNLKIKV